MQENNKSNEEDHKSNQEVPEIPQEINSQQKDAIDNFHNQQKSNKASNFKSEFWKKSDFLEFKKSLNKLLLGEETVVNLEDARESKFYFEKMRQLELCRLTLMVMAQAVAILDVIKQFRDKIAQIEIFNNKIVMTYFTYQAQNQFIIATKQFGDKVTIFNTGKWKLMLLEMSIYIIFPQPWFSSIKVHFFVDYYQITVYHYLNEVLFLIMLLRFILMAKIILLNTNWYNEKVNRICHLYATKMSPLFILKVFMKKNPMRVFWFCYVFSLFVYSYAMRICERPLLRDPPPEGKTIANFNQYATSLWVTMITIPTIGYGDTFPVTSHGRFIASITFISGTFLFSLLCNSLLTILDFNFLEQKSNLILNKLHVRDEIKATATRMFSYVAKVAYRQRKGLGENILYVKKLREEAIHFKSVHRCYKSLIDQSNLSEQIDKQFTYVQEEVGKLEESIHSVMQTQQAIVSQFTAPTQSDNIFLMPHQINLRNHLNSKQSLSSPDLQQLMRSKKKAQFASVQYFTDDMNDTAAVKQKPYNFSYNMVNHINPNQFY